ncbi:AEC family transporter [Actibacterium sp. MT2.3-13A]|uniref:AEC family transporter n=1 Tax=Actibacterium sp. MT2.3-13A TaxID=2828332 RepID=UPI001BAA2019|nr:AEC family transporter [Actibacterium sp. MT2.3-13A]
MQALLDVILPVFLVLAFGYVAVWRGLFSDAAVDGLVRFTQQFAVPILLFRGISTLDLGQNFDPRLLLSFYSGALSCFFIAMTGARLLFGRSWEDSVAIGFVGLFSNSLLLGLPITERAYGPDALAPNYAIIAIHSPFCYGVGITAMEIIRNRGRGLTGTSGAILKAMFSNALVLAIIAGFVVNLTGLPLPGALSDAVELMARTALPAALFGLGGVLFRYRPEGDLRTIAFAVTVSLVIHPAIVWVTGSLLGLSTGQFRSAVLTAAMAPGANAYIFANMYGAAKRVAASSVLIATTLSVLTVWVWLALLGH